MNKKEAARELALDGCLSLFIVVFLALGSALLIWTGTNFNRNIKARARVDSLAMEMDSLKAMLHVCTKTWDHLKPDSTGTIVICITDKQEEPHE